MNPFDLKGKTALVTGGNGGIGLGMAQGLAQAGARIAIAGRDKAKNAAAAKALDAIAREADLKDEKACRAMVEEAAKRLGRLDILINNAGMNVRKQPQDFTLDEWKLVMDTNLTSAFVAAQTAYPHLKKAGGGKIVNIGSMMSIFGASFTTAYAASKGGIVQMTRALATAWARDNIQVNAVLPGWIDTALTRGARERGVDPAGKHGVHLDVVARPCRGERARHLDDSALARGVGRSERGAEDRHHRADVDDLAAA